MDLGPGYTFYILWHERSRFLPGILAVAFSALLITVQLGMLLGLFSIMSIPVDHASRGYMDDEGGADVWVGHPNVVSVDLGQPIPAAWRVRLLTQPEFESVEICVVEFANWSTVPDQLAQRRQRKKPDQGQQVASVSEACTVIGTQLDDHAAGIVKELRKQSDLRARLREPGAIVVDEAEKGRLGLKEIGDLGTINGHRVRLVGWVHNVKALGGPFIFCSIDTARLLVHMQPGQATFLVGRCHQPEYAQRVVDRLNWKYKGEMSAFTSPKLSWQTRLHWLTKTRVGVAMGITAVLGLIVGAVITSQTLYGATVALRDQFATLVAMGIPRWRLFTLVLSISFWVGVAGICIALPIAFLIKQGIELFGVAKLPLEPWLVAPAVGITLLMALSSGAFSLRALELSKTVR